MPSVAGKRHELCAMLQGGNGRARDFFMKNKAPMDGKITEKYTCRAAAQYKGELLKSIMEDMRKNTKQYAGGESKASEEKKTQKKVRL